MNHGKHGSISISSQGRDMGFVHISTFIQRYLQNSDISIIFIHRIPILVLFLSTEFRF